MCTPDGDCFDQPESGIGFESALVYAIAAELGFAENNEAAVGRWSLEKPSSVSPSQSSSTPLQVSSAGSTTSQPTHAPPTQLSTPEPQPVLHARRRSLSTMSWLCDPATFVDGQIPPFRVEFLTNPSGETGFAEGVYNAHVGPLMSFSGVLGMIEPERYRVAVAEVPFVDVTTTMSDPTLPLTVTEWEEWGDPRSEPHASYISGYAPYDNTVAAAYPAMLVTAGLNDPRVSFHEPAKWTAKLTALSTC